MKNLPLAIKMIANIIFFALYLLIMIVFVNFVYGLIMYIANSPIPASTDSVHLKMAVIVTLFTLVFTLIFRKFFYISTGNKEDNKIEKKVENIIKEDNNIEEKSDLKIYVGRDKVK